MKTYHLLLHCNLQVDQLWQHVVTHSSPVCSHQQTTVAIYLFHRSRGGRRREEFLAMDAFPRPRPRTRLEGSKTKTKTVGSRPRPRPRPRLVKTGLEAKTQVSRPRLKSRGQDSSLEAKTQVSRPRLKSRELQVWL